MGHSKLLIIKSRSSDSGDYICNATNDVGSITKCATLTVHGEQTVNYTEYQLYLMAKTGEILSLQMNHCPSIIWAHLAPLIIMDKPIHLCRALFEYCYKTYLLDKK